MNVRASRGSGIILLLIVTVAAVLLLANLGNQYLWQDEAQTALIAKTILAHGLPLGCDGKNSFSQDLGKDYGKNYVWKWHPWLQFYVLAGFFAVFGQSTFVARLPFALFGVATVVLIYYAGWSMFGSRRVGVLAAVCLLLCVPFLILARQCRYYAPEMLFSLAGLYAYHSLLAGKRHAWLWLFLSAMLLFHTHYVHCAALLATALIHASVFRRDKLKLVIAISAGVPVLNLPWILWFSGMNKMVPAGKAAGFMWCLVGQIAKHVVRPAVMLIVPVVIGVRWRRERRFPKPERKAVQNVSLLVLFLAIDLVVGSVTTVTPWFRTIAPMLPVLALVIALLVELAIRVHRAIGLAVLAAMACFSPMRDYLYEITHDYDGPIEGIVKYLRANARPNDLVLITYGDLPVKFYTNLRVLGGLTGEDLSPASQAKWVILRRYTINERDEAVGDYIRKHLKPMDYERIVLRYPDIPYENREEPDQHRFRTATGKQPVVIHRRVAR